MGLLNAFAKPPAPPPRLPAGSFTVDRHGRLIASTLPHWFPEALAAKIARHALDTFRSAMDAQLHVSELVLHYASLQITARELRGGALIFLSPRTPDRTA
jgi:hypothetical protein